MSPNWYDPFSAGEWIKRSASAVNLGIVFMILVFAVSEFRFDWAEKLAGRYLLSINSERPETGGIWETGHQTLNAHNSLSKMIDQKEDARRSVRDAQTFSSLAKSLNAGEWTNLDKDQFKQLYLSIPMGIRHGFVGPTRLVWLLNGTTTARIFCEGQTGGIKIYFIDAGNRVIHQLDLATKDLLSIAVWNQSLPTNLDTLEIFSGRIYPASLFFDSIFELPRDMIPDLLASPERLLGQTGTITRVGIGNTAEGGYIQLGFEYSHLGDTQVLQVRAREWAVWQLSLILSGEQP